MDTYTLYTTTALLKIMNSIQIIQYTKTFSKKRAQKSSTSTTSLAQHSNLLTTKVNKRKFSKLPRRSSSAVVTNLWRLDEWIWCFWYYCCCYCCCWCITTSGECNRRLLPLKSKNKTQLSNAKIYTIANSIKYSAA